MNSNTQRKTRIILQFMMTFVFIGLFWGGYFGVAKAYATMMDDPIDGGSSWNEATLLTKETTYINVYMEGGEDPRYFRFIPDSTENYTIETSGPLDTLGSLYSSTEPSTLIESNDDYVDYNFKLIVNLSAGETYYLRVTNYDLNPGQSDLRISGNEGGALLIPDTTSPTVPSVDVPSNGTYMIGDNLDFTVNFSEAVYVDTTGGTPRIAVTIGVNTVYANYTSGSGTSALVFRYTVKAGDQDSDGITVGTMDLNGGTIKDGAGNDAVLTLNSIGSTTNVKVDGVAPTINSVSVPSNGTYKIGDSLYFAVNFSEAVYVDATGGTPRIAVIIGGTTVYASYISGSGTSTPVFRYTVAIGAQDSDGIEVGAMSLNGGTMKDGAGNDAVPTLNSIGSTTNVKVDGVAPTISSVSVPSNGTYKIGDHLDITISFSEAVYVITTGGTPFITLTIGSDVVHASYYSGTGTSTPVFRYTVANGAQDSDGIAVGVMTLNGGTMKNAVGNNAVLTLNNVASTSGVMVDGVVPAITSVQVPASGYYKEGDNLEFTVVYAEEVVVTGTTSVLKVTVGGISKDAAFTTHSGSSVIYRYIVQAGDNGGITIGSNLELGTTTIKDNTGNNALLSLQGVGSTTGITIDTIDPGAVTNISLSDNDTITGIDGRDFTLSFTELADESDVTEYRVYLYKASETPANAAAMDLLAAGSRVAVKTIAKTVSNDGAVANLGSGVTTDSKGQALNGGDYRIIIRAVDNAGNNSFAITGTSALIVNDVDIPPTGGNNPPASVSTPQTEGKIEKNQIRNENAPAASLTDNSEELKLKILSAAEQEQVAQGKDAKVILKIEDISASVSAEDKKQIDETLAAVNQNNTNMALLYIDISLFKQIGDGEETQITKTNGKISISIEVPENMRNTKDTIDRTYQIIRVHNGVAELLTGTYDPISHLFTFETDQFSTYALTYQDFDPSYEPSKEINTDKITVYNDFYHLRLTSKATKTTQKLSYESVPGADGYLIYGAQCGKQMKKLADVAGTVTGYTVNKLKQATYYKYQVKAYKVIDGKKVILASSKLIHTVTTSKIYANPSKVKADVSSMKLTVGEKNSVKCQVVLPKGMKMKEHTAVIRYESENKKIVTVSNGKVTAISKGNCYVYAYAQNGVYIKIKITVK